MRFTLTSIATTAALAGWLSVSQAQPVFALDCKSYPDVCDNTCHAVHCLGFNDPNTYLHYDANSGSDKPDPKHQSLTAGDLRRSAIGCRARVDGKSNYCQIVLPGSECDEFPYASTYDGGLGCINARYHGGDSLAMSASTRCSSGSENGEHGRKLKAFYRANNIADGGRFQVGFDPANVDNAPLCKLLRKPTFDTNRDCPDTSAGIFRHPSTPAADSYCPPRGKTRRDHPASPAFLRSLENPTKGNVTMHTITLEDGSQILTFHGARPVPGTVVSRAGKDGELEHLKVVA